MNAIRSRPASPAVAVLGLTACSTGHESSGSGDDTKPVQGKMSLTYLQRQGDREHFIGVGLGAYLACKDWQSGKPSGMRAALFINGKDVGALAVRTMYDRLKNGKEFPAEAFAPTRMVDAASWQTAGVSCG
ncbi:hypothetical protein [Streptomyces sp. NPDC056194]|uniref:hypothetical protein n=1 Tax=unclassified Streptomyces TaxID=2593676 RepID=UPI0035E1AFF5